jgi:hypothetical protein
VAIKKKKHEKLDNKNIQRVIDALNNENPITKKEACEMLNISYNTTRLSKIIDNYHEEKEYRRKRMSKNRGKPASKIELKDMIEMYLDGQPVTDIARYLFRSPAFVKANLDRIGVPTRVSEGEKFIVPDECVKYEFEVGEWVWFQDNRPDVRGGHAGKITKELPLKPERRLGHAYTIDYWIPMEWQEGFWVPWWPGIKRVKGWTTANAEDLASIQHLVDEYGINEAKL